MTLKKYLKKRKFDNTPEPKGKVLRGKLISHEQKHKGKLSEEKKGRLSEENRRLSRIFVIHEHHATHLHWDLRLEMEGVLKSWAVPKQPPESKGTKRLAIEVEDHPMEYAEFQGVIPEGNYGAGEVKIWDKGNYELLKKYSDKFILEFHGKKLKGKYCLVKTTFRNKRSWLFFKMKK